MCAGWGFFLGYYQHVLTFMKPVFSFLGYYCPKNTEFATQYPCPPGTYSEALNIWDASKCQLCPPGRVCSKPGLARPDGLCMPGWFCPPGSTSSKPVFPGNYSGMKGNGKAWWWLLLLRRWYCSHLKDPARFRMAYFPFLLSLIQCSCSVLPELFR